MLMTEYETTMVLRPDISGDTVETTLDRVREVVSKGGKLLQISHWGKRRLAYDVERHNRGIYVHTHYLGGGPVVAELERNLRISDNVLRFLTVQLATNVPDDEREAQEYARPEYEADDQIADEAPAVQASAGRAADRSEAAAAREAAEPADEPDDTTEDAGTQE